METKTKEKIQELFNNIAPHYDQNNNIISLFTHRFIKQNVISEIPNLPIEPAILDLCTGTGDIAGLLQKKFHHAKITGVDFSSEMLKIAQQKHKNILFTHADCLNLPFADSSFDLVTMSFGLRNTTDYDAALREISRVLCKGGIFVHLDFGKNSNLTEKIFLNIVKFIAEIQEDESYLYLLKSKEEFPAPEALISLFAQHGLKFEKRKDYLQGIISAQYCIKL